MPCSQGKDAPPSPPFPHPPPPPPTTTTRPGLALLTALRRSWAIDLCLRCYDKRLNEMLCLGGIICLQLLWHFQHGVLMGRPQDHCPNFRCEELVNSCVGCVNDEENFREEDTVFCGEVCALLDALEMIQVLYLQCTETHADTYTHWDMPGGCLSTWISNILVSPIVKPEESPGMSLNSDTQVSGDRCKNELLQCSISGRKSTPLHACSSDMKKTQGKHCFSKEKPPVPSRW